MKRSALILMLSLMVTAAFSFQYIAQETLDCRETVLNLELPTAKIIKYDLTHGLWTQNDEFGNKRIYQFNETGEMIIREEHANGHAFFQTLAWRVEDLTPAPFLVLSGNSAFNEKMFLIKLNCPGMVLTDISNREELTLKYLPMEADADLNQLKSNLLGDWTNITYGVEHPQLAFQNICLRPDGTFSMVKMDGNTEKGSWEVSKDGKFLLLTLTESRTNRNPGRMIARISKVDSHGLVLDQTVALGENNFELRTFTFIK